MLKLDRLNLSTLSYFFKMGLAILGALHLDIYFGVECWDTFWNTNMTWKSSQSLKGVGSSRKSSSSIRERGVGVPWQPSG